MTPDLMTSFLIFCCGVLILVLSFIWFNRKQRYETPQTPAVNLPTQEIPNDKLIVVSNGDHENLKRVLLEFCRNYNELSIKVVPRINQLNDRDFAITFPYDIDFDKYCYLINYLVYPIDIEWHPTVTAWATVSQSDVWRTEKTINKRVMLFINVDDQDYDHIMLITEDNIGYKLGFALGHNRHLLEFPSREFMSPPVLANRLSRSESEVIH